MRKILVKNHEGEFVEGTLEEDDMFWGGWKVSHGNSIQSIKIATIKEIMKDDLVIINPDDLEGKVIIDAENKTLGISCKTTYLTVVSFLLEEWRSDKEYIKTKIPTTFSDSRTDRSTWFLKDWEIIGMKNIMDYEPLKKIVVEPETMGFHARGNERPLDLKDFGKLLTLGDDSREVEIIRGLMFFYAGQKGITLGKLREFFKEKSIKLFEHDGFIKLI